MSCFSGKVKKSTKRMAERSVKGAIREHCQRFCSLSCSKEVLNVRMKTFEFEFKCKCSIIYLSIYFQRFRDPDSNIIIKL